MKVQIIYLDPQDDIASTRDKLGGAKAPRLLIVWPSRGRVLTRKLDLVLLQRYAQQHAKQIGLVTRDPDVLEHADGLGLPVFPSTDKITETGWRRKARRKPAKPPESRPSLDERRRLVPKRSIATRSNLRDLGRWAMFLLGMLAVGGLVAAVVPRATVIVLPTTERVQTALTVTLDTGYHGAATGDRLPARALSQRFQDEMRIVTTGSLSQPDTPARGRVTFTNLTEADVEIPAGTSIRSSAKRAFSFRTRTTVLLPGSEGAQVDAEVEATFPGVEGNLPAGLLDSIDGPLGLAVQVENLNPLTGGSTKLRTAVSTLDQAEVLQLLTDRILLAGETEFQKQLKPGEALFPPSLRVIQTYAAEYDRDPGEPGDTVGLKLDVEVGAIAYTFEDLQHAAENALSESLPVGKRLVPTSVISTLSSADDSSLSPSRLRVSVTGDAYRPIAEPIIQEALRGLSPELALSSLQSLVALQENPSLQLSPSWLPRLPFLAMRIQVRFVWEQ